MASKEERAKAFRAKAEIMSKGTTGEPVVNQGNYKVDIAKALNYYSTEDYKSKRKWIKDYLTSRSMTSELAILPDAQDFHVSTIGSLARLINRGQYVAPEHEYVIISKFKEIGNYIADKKEKAEQKEEAPAVTKVDKNQNLFEDVLTAIDLEIDQLINGKATDFDIATYFAVNNIPSVVSRRIAQHYKPTLDELNSIGGDDQLTEAYSYMSTRLLNKFKTFVETVINSGLQSAVNNKSRAPRKKKEVTPMMLIKGLKYLVESPEYNIKSIKSTDIIGVKELWVFNTKTRILSVYKSKSGLSVKGTTIIDFDVAESKSKRLRKPEVFLSQSLAKAAINTSFKQLTTLESNPNGRINKDMILLKVF